MNPIQRLDSAIHDGSIRVVIQSVPFTYSEAESVLNTFEHRAVKMIYISRPFYLELMKYIDDNPKVQSRFSDFNHSLSKLYYLGRPVYVVYHSSHPYFEIIWN